MYSSVGVEPQRFGIGSAVSHHQIPGVLRLLFTELSELLHCIHRTSLMSLYSVDLSSHRLSTNIQSPLYLLRAHSMRAMHDNNYIQHVEEEYKLRPTKSRR